jgi:prepilin-type N-terminal cleavage/methylation domain-containing protein
MEKKFKYLKELINKNQTGLTLIEILIALVITTIVLAGLYTVYGSVAKQFLQQTKRGNIYNSGRNLITIISRDLRMAGFQHYDNSNPVMNPIVMYDDSCNQICIVYDIDDGSSYQRRRIIYYVENEKMYRTIQKEAGGNYTVLDEYKNQEDTLLAESVKQLKFTFYDKDGKGSPSFMKDTHSTAEVEIIMKIKENVEDSLSTDVFLRNIYYYWQQE